MRAAEERRYKHLSPFELKNKLIQLSQTHAERMMLNAGRGNPNWVATTPREGFFQLGLFALREAERTVNILDLGGEAEKQNIGQRFLNFAKQYSDNLGVKFLQEAFAYIRDELKLNFDDFIFEMVDGILGDHYPTPDRMLELSEQIVHKYLEQEMFAGKPPAGKFDLFATEGGTAAMDYIFTTLMENKLLHKGDTIALGTPIFTPYLEIPKLNDYQFVELEIKQAEDLSWQYPDAEIEKLADPKVKAFFLVNPSNPTSVSVHQATLDKIADLVKTKRPDLIILTDDVYATFVNDFRSLAAAAPYNTILVYSFSKYFGATGWRLGVIGIHEDNVLDKKIADLPKQDQQELIERYSAVDLNPKEMKLIDRMVADSRSVALHHTAGLSTPQQVMMVLFSLFCLLDKKQQYKQVAQFIVSKRFKTLYDAIGIESPKNPCDTHYYTTIDVPKLAKQRYGQEFADYLVKQHEPIDFVVKLAEKKSVVLMDGGGFDAPNMSIRVSLANLPDRAYEDIGKAISELLESYYQHWLKIKK